MSFYKRNVFIQTLIEKFGKELSVKIVLFLLINILIRKRGSQNAASLCIRFSETYPLTFLLSSLRLLL